MRIEQMAHRLRLSRFDAIFQGIIQPEMA